MDRTSRPHAVDTIRASEPQDEVHLVRLAEVAFEDMGDYSHTILDWLRRPSTVTLVMSVGEGISGFVTYCYRRCDHDVYGDIIALAVDPVFRRQGIASRLLTRAITYLSAGAPQVHASSLRLHVSAGNVAGQTVFQRLGFRFQVTDGYYPNGQQALRYVRDCLPPDRLSVEPDAEDTICSKSVG